MRDHTMPLPEQAAGRCRVHPVAAGAGLVSAAMIGVMFGFGLASSTDSAGEPAPLPRADPPGTTGGGLPAPAEQWPEPAKPRPASPPIGEPVTGQLAGGGAPDPLTAAPRSLPAPAPPRVEATQAEALDGRTLDAGTLGAGTFDGGAFDGGELAGWRPEREQVRAAAEAAFRQMSGDIPSMSGSLPVEDGSSGIGG